MRLEELKKDMPETPEFIHNMIREEVDRQMHTARVIPMKKRNTRNVRRAAVVAAACLAATSTVAYAGSRIYRLVLERQGAYGVNTVISATEGSALEKLPEKIHKIAVTSEAIPEGMEWTEEGSCLNYRGKPYQGGISISEVLLDTDDLQEAKKDTHVVESEERTFGSYEGVYLRYANLKKDDSFSQRIYLMCPEVHRVLILYVADDVTREDAYAFADGLVITQLDEMLDTDGIYTWSDIVHPEVYTDELPVVNGTLPIHGVGDTFALNVNYQDAEGKFQSTDDVTVTVDDIQIADDLQLLGANIPSDWEDAVGEDGKLVLNHLTYVKAGDGVNKLDQVVKEEDVEQRLVYTTVTYTNTSDQELHQLLYMGTLMTIHQQEDGTYTIYDPEETPGDGYDSCFGDSVARNAEMGYFDVVDASEDGGNYISTLAPGASVQLHMAWIVNASDLPDLYLNLSPTGMSYTFDEDVLNTGLVYVGQ